MLYNVKILILFSALISGLISCKSNDKEKNKAQTKISKATPLVTQDKKKENKEILLQPFSDLPNGKAEYIYRKISEICKNTKLLPPIDLPSVTYYKPRNRYRADSLIQWLRKRVSANQIVAGITSKDISTTKGTNPDSGIFGLGFMNGPACIVSSFRLHSNEQLFKTVIHELGHNFGVDHCPIKTCFMRDADGRNTSNEEKEFCPACKNKLVKAGWIL